MQKISPYLWFDTNAEEAIQNYVSIFKNSRILETSRYGAGMPLPAGTLLTAKFQLEGRLFLALNGGPKFKFTEALSFLVDVSSQEELDYYWDRLAEAGTKQPCGWLKDKYGLSWQIIPAMLGEMLSDKDPARAGRVMQAMMKMDRIVIKDLQKAYEG